MTRDQLADLIFSLAALSFAGFTAWCIIVAFTQ